MHRPVFAIGAVALLLLNTAVNAATYSFFDTTFLNPAWNGVKLADTAPGQTSTFTAAQATPFGSPLSPATPEYRETSHTYGPNAIIVSHENSSFAWSPLPNETATTVDYQYDLNHFTGATVGGAVGYSPAIFQGGKVYILPYDNIFANQWTRFTGTAIPLASFNLVDPSTALTLPFSPGATTAMTFGYASANSATGVTTKVSGLDNYGFTLNTVITPEPASLASIAVASVLLRRRRRLIGRA